VPSIARIPDVPERQADVRQQSRPWEILAPEDAEHA